MTDGAEGHAFAVIARQPSESRAEFQSLTILLQTPNLALTQSQGMRRSVGAMAIHMRQSLGAWPTSIGERGFSPYLTCRQRQHARTDAFASKCLARGRRVWDSLRVRRSHGGARRKDAEARRGDRQEREVIRRHENPGCWAADSQNLGCIIPTFRRRFVQRALMNSAGRGDGGPRQP